MWLINSAWSAIGSNDREVFDNEAETPRARSRPRENLRAPRSIAIRRDRWRNSVTRSRFSITRCCTAIAVAAGCAVRACRNATRMHFHQLFHRHIYKRCLSPNPTPNSYIDSSPWHKLSMSMYRFVQSKDYVVCMLYTRTLFDPFRPPSLNESTSAVLIDICIYLCSVCVACYVCICMYRN